MTRRVRARSGSGWRWAAIVAAAVAVAPGCFRMRSSEGGGQTEHAGGRRIDPGDVALPAGYVIRPVVTGLTFPTGVAFDDQGRLHVVEAGYSYPDAIETPRLLRVDAGGRLVEIARGDNPPWNGVDFHDGHFFVAGGHVRPGEILRIAPDGRTTVLADGMTTSVGDHHTNGPRVGPDGLVYFGQGVLTNSGVVGLDSAEFGWLARYPQAHDVPCRDVVLTGLNFRTPNPLTPDPDDEAVTGTYMPFGVPAEPGQIVRGQVPCGGAVMRVPPAGGEPELVAWGLRNPFGLTFAPDGALYVTDNAYDVRGSRPVFGAGDLLWRITPGQWYGWPDFWARRRIDDADWFSPPGRDAPRLALAEHPDEPPEPAAYLAVHASSSGLDVARGGAFGHAGQLFVAQFGDLAPNTGKVLAPVGFKVVRVDPDTGVVHEFAANRGETHGPASWLDGGGLERPVSVRFAPDGGALYVVDFGVVTTTDGTMRPRPGTGVVWRIERSGR